MLRFAVINMIDNEAVFMTTYMISDRDNNRVESGSTWNSKSFRSATLNTECKLMLLEHAYEKLGCICVEFWRHFMNHQSEMGIEIKKARLEGILRSNAIQKIGPISDQVVYLFINY